MIFYFTFHTRTVSNPLYIATKYNEKEIAVVEVWVASIGELVFGKIDEKLKTSNVI